MNLTNLRKRSWFNFSAAWRREGGDSLELWLPRNWPAEDSELRWRRVAAGGAVQKGAQRGLEGLAPAVTRRERMESWLAALAAAGLAPTHLAPVTLSVPLAERAWTLAFVDGEIVLRSGARAGLGGPAERRPPAWLHAALAEARTEASAPERLLLVDAPADLDSAAWREALGLPLESMRPGDASVPAAPLDLLQQHYAPRAHLAALKRAYIPTAALLAAWLFATLALDAIEWARLSRAASAAEEEMRALLLKS